MSLKEIIDKLIKNCEKKDCNECIAWAEDDCLLLKLNYTYDELIESQNKFKKIIDR